MLSALIILSLAGCGRGGAVEHATLDTEEAVTEEVATDGDSTDEKEDTASTGDVAEVASDGDVSNALIYAAARDEYRDNDEGVRLYTKSYDELYIMDEPSANLDTAGIEGLKECLEKIKNEGKTVIIAEHRLYYLTQLVDRVIYLKDGKIEKEINGDEFRTMSVEALNQMGLRSHHFFKGTVKNKKEF